MIETMTDPAGATTTPDMDLIDATLAEIDRHPETWDQAAWRCETGMCFAGTAATLAGAPWLTDISGRLSDYRFARTHMGEPLENFAAELISSPGGRYVHAGAFPGDYVDNAEHVKEWARRRLGLTTSQAAAMFEPENSLEDLRAFRDRLAADPADTLALDGYAMDWESL